MSGRELNLIALLQAAMRSPRRQADRLATSMPTEIEQPMTTVPDAPARDKITKTGQLETWLMASTAGWHETKTGLEADQRHRSRPRASAKHPRLAATPAPGTTSQCDVVQDANWPRHGITSAPHPQQSKVRHVGRYSSHCIRRRMATRGGIGRSYFVQ